MAQWVIGQRIWQRSTGASWVSTDVTIPKDSAISMRGAFTIANGDEPINTGNLMVQRYIGGAWKDWQSYYGKNVRPGYTIGILITLPQYAQWGIAFQHDGALRTRLKIDWDGGPYYSSEIVVTTTTVSEIWTETEKDPDSWTETEKATDTWEEAEISAVSWAESEKAGDSWTQTQVSATSWGESEKAADSWTESKKTSDSWTETEKAADSWTESEKAADTFTESEKADDSWTETESAATTWTEGSA